MIPIIPFYLLNYTEGKKRYLKTIEFLKKEKSIAEEIIEDAPSHTQEEVFYQEGRVDAYDEAILMISGNSHLVRRFTQEDSSSR